MSRIIFATGNQNKMREIRETMQGFRGEWRRDRDSVHERSRSLYGYC